MKLRRSRLSDGVQQAIQMLVTARNAMSKDRTRSINALAAVVCSNDLGLDARTALPTTQIVKVSAWQARKEELTVSVARAEAIRQAKHVWNWMSIWQSISSNSMNWCTSVKRHPCWKKGFKPSVPLNVWPPGPITARSLRRRNSPVIYS